MPQKINWKLFWTESSILVTHVLLAGFYFKISHVLFEYYKAPILGTFFVIIGLFFALPLFINFLDLWARSMGAVCENAAAEKMMKASIAFHEKLWGSNNAFIAEKQAMLASVYFDGGKRAEAEILFAEAWKKFRKAFIKSPRMHMSFVDYVRVLNQEGKIAEAEQVQASIKKAQRLLLAQKLCTLIFTTPIICFLIFNQTTERNIAKHNAHGQTLVALKEITSMADGQALLLGPYAAARTYSDYAQAFDEPESQIKEMEWCADKALAALKRSPKSDEYLQVLLLNLKAKARFNDDKEDEGIKYLQQAVAISNNWDKEKLARNKYDAAVERGKAILELAELERTKGNYEDAEQLYRRVLVLPGDNANQKILNAACLDPVETVDRLHKLQHIQLKLGKTADALKAQEKICSILESSVKSLTANSRNSAVCDFGVREASRELDICAMMLQDVGRGKEAKDYQARAEHLRNTRIKSVKLNRTQQDSIVDATTKLTNDLLSVKYRAGNWRESLSHLLNDELTSKNARGAFEHLPWYDAKDLKAEHGGKLSNSDKTLSVDISPMSIKTNREGDGIAVDVSGTVKILNTKSHVEDEQKFGFGYVLKSQNAGHHSIEDLMDNQALAHIQMD